MIGIDGYAAEIVLNGDDQWQSVSLSPTEFQDVEGNPLPGWDNAKELRIGAMETLRAKERGATKSRVLGASWQGPKPDFRNLGWITDTKIIE